PRDDGTLLYEVTGQREQTFTAVQPLPILTCALHPDGHSLGCLARSLWGAHIRDITVWPLGDAQEGFPDDSPIRKDGGWWGPAATESVSAKPGDNDFTMAFSPHWQLLAHKETGGVMLRGHTSRLRPRRLPNVEGIEDATVCFDPAGNLWGALDYDVRVWDTDLKEQFRWSNAAERDRSGLASLFCIAAGHSWAVVGGRDGRLRLFHTSKPRLAWTKRAANAPLRSVALSPDETFAAAASDTGEIHVFHLPGGETAMRLPAHRDRVSGLSWSRYGLLASGAHDRTVKLWRWNGSALSEVLTLRQPAPVRWLAFHRDGVRLFVLLDGERAVRVWHLDRLWARLGDMGLDGELPRLKPIRLPAPAPEVTPDPLVVDPPHGPNGLRAELFDELGCNHCVKVRHDLPATFDLGVAGLDSRLPGPYYSVRWTGWLKPPRPGGYILSLESSNYVRLWLDDKIALTRGPDTDETCETGVWMEGPAALRVEYIKNCDANRLAVKWRQPGGFPLQPISPLALFHDKATAEKATVPWPERTVKNAH
ncbi:MAG TPA: PA14 domain-containing protein, partial [Gemmataceae bacterium]|nr:PA14 domain-containing protein [Gemmataceae bacterium]